MPINSIRVRIRDRSFFPLCFISLFLLGICTPHPRRVCTLLLPPSAACGEMREGDRFSGGRSSDDSLSLRLAGDRRSQLPQRGSHNAQRAARRVCTGIKPPLPKGGCPSAHTGAGGYGLTHAVAESVSPSHGACVRRAMPAPFRQGGQGTRRDGRKKGAVHLKSGILRPW